jgi:hypothetical protein
MSVLTGDKLSTGDLSLGNYSEKVDKVTPADMIVFFGSTI